MTHLLRHKLSSPRIVIFAALAGLIVAAQGLIVAHGAAYGDGPHDHNGKPCVVSVISQAGDKFVGTAGLMVAAVVITWRAAGAPAQTERAALAVRAARPRGPPCR